MGKCIRASYTERLKDLWNRYAEEERNAVTCKDHLKINNRNQQRTWPTIISVKYLPIYLPTYLINETTRSLLKWSFKGPNVRDKIINQCLETDTRKTLKCKTISGGQSFRGFVVKTNSFLFEPVLLVVVSNTEIWTQELPRMSIEMEQKNRAYNERLEHSGNTNREPKTI